jgi:hypothetical protein
MAWVRLETRFCRASHGLRAATSENCSAFARDAQFWRPILLHRGVSFQVQVAGSRHASARRSSFLFSGSKLHTVKAYGISAKATSAFLTDQVQDGKSYSTGGGGAVLCSITGIEQKGPTGQDEEVVEPKERLGTGSLGVRIFSPKLKEGLIDGKIATTEESLRGGKGRPKSNGEVKARELTSEVEVARTGGSVGTTTASDQQVDTRRIEDTKQESGQKGPVSEQAQVVERGIDSAVVRDGEEASRNKTLALSERLLELQKRSGRDPSKPGRGKEQLPVRPPQRVWRKERVSASAPTLEDGSGRQLTLVEERALVNVFARR